MMNGSGFRRRKGKWRLALLILAILGLTLAGGWYGLHSIPADFIYGVETDFAEVPTDDRQLQMWLKAQPGVWQAWVERHPSASRTRVVVIFGMTRNGWGQPPFPNLDSKCSELGYRGRTGPFRDQETP